MSVDERTVESAHRRAPKVYAIRTFSGRFAPASLTGVVMVPDRVFQTRTSSKSAFATEFVENLIGPLNGPTVDEPDHFSCACHHTSK